MLCLNWGKILLQSFNRNKEEVELIRLMINLEKALSSEQKLFNKIQDIFLNLSMKPFSQQDILNGVK